MDTNKSNIENIEFITFIRSARQRSSTAAQLRHENAGLLQIIADFDARLATVEAERDMIADTCKRTHELCVKWQEETRKVVAERDALQQRLDGLSKLPVIDLSQHRRISRTGSLSRDII
jgi:hypothetical protein